MKKLFFVVCLISSMASLNAVEIVNNTQKSIKFTHFKTLLGRKIMIYPFTLRSGETHKDLNIASCVGYIEDKIEGIELPKEIGIYRLDNLQEDTLVSFIEFNGKIEAHKLDKILPKTKRASQSWK